MKVLLALGCILLACLTLEVSGLSQRQLQTLSKTRVRQIVQTPPTGKVDLDLCPTCVSFTEEVDDIIMSILLDIGVVDTCGVLCTILQNKTGSQVIGVVCQILCDVVGFDEFIKAITKADLDPIYFCELTRLCPIFDQGDAQITELYVNPTSGPPGQRTIGFTYVSKNGTGTGQLNMNITTVDGFPVAASFLKEKQPAGTYPVFIQLDAEKADDCHPEKAPCERWKKGNYTITMSVCNGECFSKHPHSQVYDRRSVNFTITREQSYYP